ncbi:MAG: lysine--tRNA ligase [Mycoplasmataceae bacterium]|nr:lysine--tRNA ligase [Mycoplasmataceae bacterium]
MKDLTEQETIRRNKITLNKKLGIKSYTNKKEITNSAKNLFELFSQFSREELESKNSVISTYGRLMNRRGPFIEIKWEEFRIQLYINKKMDEKLFYFTSNLDIGDIIWAKGLVIKTMTNELAIKTSEIELMSKSLKVLPEKYHGLVDVEERYRHRYVDLITNDSVREIFIKRSIIIKEVRKFFDEQEYLEVDTPILSSVSSGASAKPFITHYNALDTEFYLRIATELPLKKLIVGGLSKVYEIGRLFRNEGIDTTHNPEFTTIEFYEANTDMWQMMSHTESLFKRLAKLLNMYEFEYQGIPINFNNEFKKIEMCEAVSRVTGFDVKNAEEQEIIKFVKKEKMKIESFFKKGHLINLIFEEKIEKTLINPTFVYGHPIEISPFAVKSKDNPNFTERAELFINGREYANMFTELSDPIDQLERFKSQLSERDSGNLEANQIDWDFVKALEYGMPPTGGCGIGIDRLVMLFTKQISIREVLLFPHMKNK